jgi:ZIP family zinc transporter
LRWISDLLDFFLEQDIIVIAFLAGIFLTILNLLGATTLFFIKKPSTRLINAALGLAAGIMLAASFTSLIIPGIEKGGVFPVLVGLGVGGLFIALGDRAIGKFGIHSYSPTQQYSQRRLHGVMLFVFAVTLHNLPEGLAVGVGFGAEDITKALILMIAIGIQNIPEGLAVGFSLIATERYSRKKSFWYAFLSGAVETPLTILGALWIASFSPILPYAMGFAAGAMVFVIGHEIIPQTHAQKTEVLPTMMLMIGLIVMLVLDVSLG